MQASEEAQCCASAFGSMADIHPLSSSPQQLSLLAAPAVLLTYRPPQVSPCLQPASAAESDGITCQPLPPLRPQAKSASCSPAVVLLTGHRPVCSHPLLPMHMLCSAVLCSPTGALPAASRRC